MISPLEAQELARQGRWQEAEDAYQRILEGTPGNVEALSYLATAKDFVIRMRSKDEDTRMGWQV